MIKCCPFVHKLTDVGKVAANVEQEVGRMRPLVGDREPVKGLLQPIKRGGTDVARRNPPCKLESLDRIVSSSWIDLRRNFTS
jgi:hypothetical protein